MPKAGARAYHEDKVFLEEESNQNEPQGPRSSPGADTKGHGPLGLRRLLGYKQEQKDRRCLWVLVREEGRDGTGLG